ncbi:hypothetical protein SAMN05421640_2356 [Ekhidna lutea]|uniref:Anti-sigma factor n=1 Tax=Ekhidna lutea TaxID=447679 RepID=A0A239K099_EKHLU|nr:hypothetical protein [Ekhidna lutea]SNT11787.1 hypothetical protein SAMN05421640_2356 [Ekhidna lutea]
MGDQLEKFIMENREVFDDATPSENVWKGIDNDLSKKRSIWPTVWKVAAMLFMASTIFLMIDRNAEVEEGPYLSEEFNQAEDYYVKLISQRKQEIKAQLTPEQQEQFLVEIDQLDSMYVELKKTYQTNASNDRVMDAMINNLQLRLDILNKQLDILQNIKNQNNENDISIEI